jgi:riboflavin synthase
MFCVNIIEHTWRNTNLGDSALGSCLNLEIDMLARYVSRLMQVAGEIK